MTRQAAQTFGIHELHETVRTALDYVDAVRGALEAMEAGMKKTPMREFGEGPFVRKACALAVRGPAPVRKGCLLAIKSPSGTRRARRKPAHRR